MTGFVLNILLCYRSWMTQNSLWIAFKTVVSVAFLLRIDPICIWKELIKIIIDCETDLAMKVCFENMTRNCSCHMEFVKVNKQKEESVEGVKV